MIKVVYGNKGIGKTKYLVEDVHKLMNDCKGDIVFIDTSNQLVTDLRHEIRYINISDFPVANLCSFYGFICGLIAEDYDIMAVYVDGLDKISEKNPDYKDFFEKINILNNKFNIRFLFSLNGDVKDVPDYVQKEYTC